MVQSYSDPVALELSGPNRAVPSGVIYATTVHDAEWAIFVCRRSEHGQYYHVVEAFRASDAKRQTLVLFQGCPERVSTLGAPGLVLLFRRGGHSRVWSLDTGRTHVLSKPYLEAVHLGNMLIMSDRSEIEAWRFGEADLKPTPVERLPRRVDHPIDAIGVIPCRNQYAVLYRHRMVYVYDGATGATVSLGPRHPRGFQIPEGIDTSRVFPTIWYLGSGILLLLSRASYRHPSRVIVLSVFGTQPWAKTLSLRRACDRLHPVSANQFIVRSTDGIHSFALNLTSGPDLCTLVHLQRLHLGGKGNLFTLGHNGVTLSSDQGVYTLQ